MLAPCAANAITADPILSIPLQPPQLPAPPQDSLAYIAQSVLKLQINPPASVPSNGITV